MITNKIREEQKAIGETLARLPITLFSRLSNKTYQKGYSRNDPL